ncbi:hypothetical protein GCM10020216_085530 [Nonomuraea helvata]
MLDGKGGKIADGSRYRAYSNTDYILLGLIIESLTESTRPRARPAAVHKWPMILTDEGPLTRRSEALHSGGGGGI